MKVLVLFGQRKCSYPGEFGLEALACMDEYGNGDNPDYMREQHEEYQASDEFDRLAIITLDVDDTAIAKILYPEAKPVPASVIDEPNGDESSDFARDTRYF
jgi:hypothetical protein